MNFTTWLSVVGGLGFFIYGMGMMGDGLEKSAGDKLRDMLSLLTSKRILGILVGAGVTAVIQSSSATTVMVVGFVNAGLMTLQQALGVIMGASIGTTITGYIVALNLSDIAPIFVVVGVIMQMVGKRKMVKRISLIVLGFGILFVGMGMMSTGLKPLRSSEVFRNIIVTMESPLLGILAGAAITAVIQSSSAFSGIIITLAASGLVTIDAAAPMLIGANIGTCATALLVSIGTTTTAKRAALMHLIYKVIGAVLFMILMQFVPVIELLKDLIEDNTTQVVTFNTIYNVVTCALLYFAGKPIIKLTSMILPEVVDTEAEEKRMIYIDERLFDSPPLVVPRLRLEVERMKDMATKNLTLSIEAFKHMNTQKNEKLQKREEVINYLNHSLMHVLVKASALDLSDSDRRAIGEMYHIIVDIERIGDHAQNIMEYVEVIEDNKLVISDTAAQGLIEMGSMTLATIDYCWDAYKAHDLSRYDKAESMENEVDEMHDKLADEHYQRLNQGLCEARSSMIFTDMISDLERCSDHAMNMLTAIHDNMLDDIIK